MTLFKAQAAMRDLTQNEYAYNGGSAILSYDSNGFPITQFTDANSAETIFVQIMTEPDPANPVNALGQPQFIYSPHQVTVLRDSTVTSIAFRALIDNLTARLGMKQLIYEVHPLPASYTLTGATLVSQVGSDGWNPLTQSE